jgi:hypothetical protein
VSGFDDIVAEVLFADHDKRAQTMAKTSQKPVLFAGQLNCCGDFRHMFFSLGM